MREPIVWISTPTQFDARHDLPARLRVYHIVDDYLAYHDLPAERRPRWASLERQLIDWADLVVAVSPELMQSKGGLSQGGLNPKFRLLPNAVDPCLYADDRPLGPAPELEGLPRPVLGYVGLVSVRLDLGLLDELAARHPEWTLVLIGTVFRSGCGELLDRLAARPNVRLLPPVPAERVADYVRRFDVGLAPYRVTQETIHASPLKIYEDLAAGLPWSRPMCRARQFADVLALADTADAWKGRLWGSLARPLRRRAARRRAVAPHTWDARVETLSGFLAEALTERGGPMRDLLLHPARHPERSLVLRARRSRRSRTDTQAAPGPAALRSGCAATELSEMGWNYRSLRLCVSRGGRSVRIAMILRPDADRVFGGDTVVMRKLGAALCDQGLR